MKEHILTPNEMEELGEQALIGRLFMQCYDKFDEVKVAKGMLLDGDGVIAVGINGTSATIKASLGQEFEAVTTVLRELAKV